MTVTLRSRRLVWARYLWRALGLPLPAHPQYRQGGEAISGRTSPSAPIPHSGPSGAHELHAPSPDPGHSPSPHLASLGWRADFSSHKALVRLAKACAEDWAGGKPLGDAGKIVRFFVATDNDEIRAGLELGLDDGDSLEEGRLISYHPAVPTRETARGIQEALIDIMILSQVGDQRKVISIIVRNLSLSSSAMT